MAEETKTDKITCTVVNGILECCASLDRAADDTYGSGKKGVTYLQLTDLKTMEPGQSGAVLRSGEFAKNGVIMNYCPFCGVAIGHHFKAAEPAPPEGGTA